MMSWRDWWLTGLRNKPLVFCTVLGNFSMPHANCLLCIWMYQYSKYVGQNLALIYHTDKEAISSWCLFDIKLRFREGGPVKRGRSAFGMHVDFNITRNNLHVMMLNWERARQCQVQPCSCRRFVNQLPGDSGAFILVWAWCCLGGLKWNAVMHKRTWMPLKCSSILFIFGGLADTIKTL